jgi:hypothetical protein
MSVQSHRSYCIASELGEETVMPGEPVAFTFSIVDDHGTTLKDFTMTHDMLLHLVVVRKDLANFQHLHPEFDPSSGTFMLRDLAFPSAGEYRIYADFVPGSARADGGIPSGVTVARNVSVDGDYAPEPLSEGSMTSIVNGYEVTLTTDPANLSSGRMGMLSFAVTKDGVPVTDLEPYLAALGHSVIIREGTLDYVHAHPVQDPAAAQNGTIDFHTGMPFAGMYKIFTQFKHQGRVMLVDFVLPVAGDLPEEEPSETDPIHGMDH